MVLSIDSIVTKGLDSIIGNENYREFPSNFIYPKTINKYGILFIGINPSSGEEQREIDSYELLQRGNEHPYFKKFEEISECCNLHWTHLDLLFFRETDQNKIHWILKQKHGVDFIWNQLIISKELISLCEPKIIVVCNALAGTFFGKDKIENKNLWLNYDLEFKDEIGTYTLSSGIPVFFSGMLTGQRALDRGSYERLIWHIKRTIKNQEL